MAKKGGASRGLDDFPNIMSGTITESGANTLSFSSKLETGYSLGDNVGLVIHRMEWWLDKASVGLLLDNADAIKMALVTSNQVSSILVTGSNIIDIVEIGLAKYGVAASGWAQYNPVILRDFTSLPGGGFLVAPNPLYIAINGVSLASAASANWRMFYTTVSLNDKGFRELWETWNALRV